MASKVKVTRHSPKPEATPEEIGCSCSSACCCGGNPEVASETELKAQYITGSVQTPVVSVPQVSTNLAMKDIAGIWKARWGIGRMSYTVEPGLYCIGNPDENSPVLVTANYKLSFDKLRKKLSGLSVWLLVLDTKGVNVWCAAGKGTFGTDELVRRIETVRLGNVVKHRAIILPQLGATGVAADEVAKRSGFHVIYGPVRASDVKAFLEAGMKATPEMRTVNFTLLDRLVLTPVELVGAIKPLILLFGVLFILNAIGFSKFGLTELVAFIGAVVTGCIITPILLPWIPGRAFSFKGALLGLLWTAIIIFLNGWLPQFGYLKAASYLLLLPTVSAYLAMNFTGCSTYTSPSGVNKEMRIAIPIMLGSSLLGIICLLADSIIKAFH
jgi:hypothetical protein